ncbi:uncharacterized protein LOC144013339 [Festucalex cinctus]
MAARKNNNTSVQNARCSLHNWRATRWRHVTIACACAARAVLLLSTSCTHSCRLLTRAERLAWTAVTSFASNAPESKMDSTNGTDKNTPAHFQAQCPPPPSPRPGTHIVNTGNGRSVGTAISLQCPSKHRLVGGELKCVMDGASSPRWVGEPSCKPLSLYKDGGFRVAVLASIVSMGIIFIMSLAFITCCILDSVHKNTRKNQRRDSFKRHLEDGMSHYSIEGSSDVQLGEHFSARDADVPENLSGNSPPGWFTYGLGHTKTITPPRPSGFHENQHPIPQKSDLGRPHYVAVSSCCKCSSSGLVWIPSQETDSVWQPPDQKRSLSQMNSK